MSGVLSKGLAGQLRMILFRDLYLVFRDVHMVFRDAYDISGGLCNLIVF
jgi:hypothetical protein